MVTLEEFKIGLTKRATMLRKHNLLPTVSFTSYVHPRYRKRIEVKEPTLTPLLLDDLFDDL